MGTPPTPGVINLNDFAPVAPPGRVNVRWSAGAPIPALITFNGQTFIASVRATSANVAAPGSGGSGSVVAVVKVPITTMAPGNFTVAHGLGFAPAFVMLEMSSGGNIWLQKPTAFDATNLYLTASDAGISAIACLSLSGPDLLLSLTSGAPGNFLTPHGLGVAPALVVLQMTSGGAIWFQSPGWDATNVKATASDTGVTAFAYCWLKVPIVAISGYSQIPLAPGAPGNFTVPHGLGQIPTMVLINMTSGGNIWQQAVPYDATNLYLVASDGGITGDAEVWVG